MIRAVFKGALIFLSCIFIILTGCMAGSTDYPNKLPNGTQVNNLAESIPVINPPSPSKEIIINVDDYKGNERGEVSDWKAIKAAIEAATVKGATVLRFENRIYNIDDPDIGFINGNAHFTLQGLSDIILDGQGAELRFHHIKRAFAFLNCNRVITKNLVIDWDRPMASPGVVEIDKMGRTVIRVVGDFEVNENTPVGCISEYDIKKMKWEMDGLELYYPPDVKLIADNTFYSPSFNMFKQGMEVLLRHYTYEAHAFDFSQHDNRDLQFENITIYQCPGMAFVSTGGDSGFRIAGCTIKRREGTNNLISATADGIHFGGTIGNIIIEDCDFSHMGDDSVNIHGNWMQIVGQEGNKTLCISAKSYYAVEAGHEFGLFRKKNLEEYARLIVSKSTMDDNNNIMKVTFEQEIPDDWAIGDYVGNLSRGSNNFIIRNNYFHDHRARGMLIQSSNGLILDNRIENVMAAAIQMTTDTNYWFEGFGCKNVVVKNNTIIGSNYATWERGPGGRHMAAINIVVDTKDGLGDYPVHKYIEITDNIIIDTPGLAILAASASDVIIKNNTIINSNTQPFITSGSPLSTGKAIGAEAKGTIMITRASNVEISGNHLSTTMEIFDRGIYSDPLSTEDIRISNNYGFD